MTFDEKYTRILAYIQSQKHEGWAASTERYDDGGFAGGNADRPALQKLLADVQAGKIRTVVAYKVDRLTRSLSDFAKIIDIFDKHKVRKELDRREHLYRSNRSALKVHGLTVILADDGIATGSAMRAAILALRQMKPGRVVVAVPVAPQSTCRRLRSEVDRLVCVHMPEDFHIVGQFYEDFSQVVDEEVTQLLQRAAQPVPSESRTR